MQISYLHDYPDFVVPLASLLHDHWRSVIADDSAEARIVKLRRHLNRNDLPIAWIAHKGGETVGTASLRRHDLDGREDLTPWLGGVYVAPSWRHRGVGAALCRTVEQKAAALGIAVLHLFTLDKQEWYARQGWLALEPCSWHDHRGVIMRKTV